MEEIHLHEPYILHNIPPVVLVLGFFDGIHLGHQALLRKGRLKAEELGLSLAVLSFNQHPSVIFKKQDRFQYLSTKEEKKEELARFGVDRLYTVDFTSRFAHLSAADFVKKYIQGLKARYVVVGFDYHYGAHKEGDAQQLQKSLASTCPVEIVPCFMQGTKVSSTRIRNLLRQGQMEEVKALLGRPYQMKGIVIPGDARGRTLGFPTANLRFAEDQLLPMEGIYIVQVQFEGQLYMGMASIGHNMTFGQHHLSVEVHLLDFNEEIYGEELQIFWLHYLRAEVQFDSVTELIQQLKADEKATRTYFQKEGLQ